MSAEEKDAEPVDIGDLDVGQMLRFFIGALAGKALEYMGAKANEGEPVKDLRQAKVAIDSVSALIEQLATLTTENEVKQLKGLLADLQLSFVMAG